MSDAQTGPPRRDSADAEWLAERLVGVRPGELYDAIADLLLNGAIAPGQQLPRVRDVALHLEIGVGSVSTAWARLQREGLLVTRRRGGTYAAASIRSPLLPDNLVTAPPDPELLPDLGRVIAAVTRTGRDERTTSLLPELHHSGRLRWPYRAPAMLALPSVRQALHLTLTALASGGVCIATVDPLCQRTAGILRRHGAPVIAVEEDDHGPIPDSLADAIARGARLFFYEPTLSVPTGTTLTQRRSEELADVIRAAPDGFRVFEEQTTAALIPTTSLGTLVPERVLSAASYARAFGSDLSIALLSGPQEDIDLLTQLQIDEGGQAGVLAQRMLARLLLDRTATRHAQRAAQTYRRRNEALRRALEQHDIAARGAGFFLWVPVEDETAAISSLAERGIRASPGRRSRLVSRGRPHMRIATTRIPDEPRAFDELSRLIARAAYEPSVSPPSAGQHVV